MNCPPPRRIVSEALAIVALGAALGLAFNYRMILESLDLPATPALSRTPPPVAPSPAPTSVAAATLTLNAVRDLLAAGALPIDARPRSVYAEGHLPAAYSLPLEEAHAAPQRLPQLPGNRTLIVYCGGYGCSDAADLALLLIQAGYREVRVFTGGYPEWVDAALPVETGTP